MKLSVLACFFFLLISNIISAQDQRWGLQRCVEYGMKNNINVRQAVLQAEQSKINYEQSQLQGLPTVSYGFSHGFSFGRTLDRTTNIYTSRSSMFEQMTLQSNLLLFNFNSRKNSVAANQYNWEADKVAVEKAANDIGLNIAQLYLRSLLSFEQVEISRVVLQQTKAQLENTRILVDAGSLPELNAAELEATVARDSATYVQAVSQASLDKLSLKSLLTLPADQPFDLIIPPVDGIPVENIFYIAPDAVFQSALITQPQIHLNDLRLTASEKNLLAIKAQMKPTLSAFGQLGTSFNQFLKKSSGFSFSGEQLTGAYIKDGPSQIPVYAPSYDLNYQTRKFSQYLEGYSRQLRDQFGQGIGLSLNVPIFNGGQSRANVQRAVLDVKRSNLAIERDKLQLKQDVYTAYYSALGAFQTFLARDKAVTTASRSFELASKRYDLGVMQTIEWLTNQNNLTRARIDKVVAQYEYVFRMKVLEFFKGQGVKL